MSALSEDAVQVNEKEEEDEYEYDCIEVIDRNHLNIVTNIDLERQFIMSYLRSKSVLDDEDCEIISKTGNTRQQKVSIFLDVIKRKGVAGVKHFFDSLEYEHPSLYEQCTGKKPTAVMTPFPHMSNGTWNWTTGLAGKELIDFDRVILAKQLQQTANDLSWITRSLHKAQEEKNIIEKHFLEANNKNQMQQQHIKELKEIIEKSSEIKRLTVENCAGNNEAVAQAQCLQRAIEQEIVQKTNLIIALQGKLLAQTEEIDDMRKENGEFKLLNTKLKEEVLDLTLMCDSERRNSKRLNEQVITHHDKMRQVDSYKMANRDLKLRLSCMAEERDELKRELNEFRKYSEVLNAKYSIIDREKCKLKEHKDELSVSYLSARDQINDISIRCTALDCDNAYLLRNNKRYQSDIKTYRENQKTLQEERERLMKERDEAWKAAESSQEELLRYKREHDEAIHNQMVINSALDGKYRDAVEEVEDIRACLRQTNEELVLTKKRLGSELSRSSGSFTFESLEVPDIGPKKESDTEEDVQISLDKVSDCSDDESKNTACSKYAYKKRPNKDLLDSIKRKVSGEEERRLTVESKSQSLPAKGLMTFDQIRLLYGAENTIYTDSPVMTLPKCNKKNNELLSTISDIIRTSSSISASYPSVSPRERGEEVVNANEFTRLNSNKETNSNEFTRLNSNTENKSVRREVSEESVFEHSFNGSLPLDVKSVFKRQDAVRHLAEVTSKQERDSHHIEPDMKGYRKRSILVDTQAWNRERSSSVPVSLPYSCKFQDF